MISLWWDILKDAKVSGKTTGESKTLDSSRIKIQRPENCKRELKQILSNALKYVDKTSTQNRIEEKYIDNKLSEEVACAFVKTLKFKLPSEYGFDGVSQSSIFPVFDNRIDKIMLSYAGSYFESAKVFVVLKAHDEEQEPSSIIQDYGGKFKEFSVLSFTRKDYAKWVKSI